MHSSELRGHDFQIRMSGEEIAHHDFFAGTRTTDRLGIVSPGALDGLGATAFILASVTAFYDAVRSEAAGTNTSSFRTYPEFYSFQLHPPCAAYGMLDIWPDHKDVPVTGAHPTLAQSVIDRSIHTLLLPACVPSSQESGSSREPDPKPYDEVHVASLQRAIRHAYLYDATGQMDDAD
ncbi:MAG: hypothetical protein HOH74_24540, partial [Gemmatimonadetes bacterium]|nr:hypothetical protein [Gemmatimonadota bacterium]